MEQRDSSAARPTRRALVAGTAAAAAGVLASKATHAHTGNAAPQPSPAVPTITAYSYEAEPYPLPAGPHLFIDHRYIQCGRVGWKYRGGNMPLFKDVDSPQIDLADVTPDVMRVPYGIRLEAQPAERIGPVLRNDRPWEYQIGYNTLHFMDGKFRLWYDVVPPDTKGDFNVLCYAESEDGLNWTKPNLGLYDWRGSKDNNIVFGGDMTPTIGFHGSSLFIDPNAPPAERVKTVFMAIASPQEIERMKREHPGSVTPIGERKQRMIKMAASPDGIRNWKVLDPIVMVHQSDTETIIYYDQFLKKYVGYYRWIFMNRRMIARAESDQLVTTWPAPEMILGPDPMDDPSMDLYTNSAAIYPRSSTMHLMFPTLYQRRYDASAIRIASSPDGRLWSWNSRNPQLETGQPGTWDGGCIFGGYGLVELPDNRVVLPYVGYPYPHKFPRLKHFGEIGLAAWGKERLSAVVADEDGEFSTQSLAVAGNSLQLNFSTHRAGYIKVEIDSDHSFDACDMLTGDHLKKTVTWKGNPSLGASPGKGITIRFKLRGAKLFSFEIV